MRIAENVFSFEITEEFITQADRRNIGFINYRNGYREQSKEKCGRPERPGFRNTGKYLCRSDAV